MRFSFIATASVRADSRASSTRDASVNQAAIYQLEAGSVALSCPSLQRGEILLDDGEINHARHESSRVLPAFPRPFRGLSPLVATLGSRAPHLQSAAAAERYLD